MMKLARGTVVLMIVGLLLIVGAEAALAEGGQPFDQIENLTQLAQYEAHLMDQTLPAVEKVAETDAGNGPEQITNLAELATYQSTLADRVAPSITRPHNVLVIAQRSFGQIENRSQLAQYQSTLLDGRMPEPSATMRMAVVPVT
ncbi:MAG: hypothetical protein ACK2UO_00310, partial [Caldilineaceae bacterium]